MSSNNNNTTDANAAANQSDTKGELPEIVQARANLSTL